MNLNWLRILLHPEVELKCELCGCVESPIWYWFNKRLHVIVLCEDCYLIHGGIP